MAIDNVGLVNAALMLVGAEKINSLTDNTKSARLASNILEQCTLEVFDLPIDIENGWKFAKARAQLARLNTDPAFGSYDYQYNLPDNCRRILHMCDVDGDKTEYEFRREVYISGSTKTAVILTNEETVYVKYMAYIDDPAMRPAWFNKLIIINIALYLFEPLKQTTQMFNKIMGMFDVALDWAKSANASEDVDVNDNNENLDTGNNDVVNAATNGIDETQIETIRLIDE